jgi:GTP-binding protein
VGDLPTRSGGAMIADRTGVSTAYALDNLQQRGEMFIGPGVDVYEGMIIGETSRGGDMYVNVCREKQKTNIRTHAADDAIKLTPPASSPSRRPSSGSPTTSWSRSPRRTCRLRKRILKEQDRRRLSR